MFLEFTKKELYHLYIELGLSTRDIGKIYKVSHHTIRDRLKKHVIVKESKQIKTDTRKKLVGRIFTENHRKAISKANTGKVRTVEHRVHYRNSKLGDKNPAYRNGKFHRKTSLYVRTLDEYKHWRTSVFKRDNFTCQDCGCGGYIEAHHINSLIEILKFYNINNKTSQEHLILYAKKYDKLWNIDNGITYCRKCHMTHDNYFKNINGVD